MGADISHTNECPAKCSHHMLHLLFTPLCGRHVAVNPLNLSKYDNVWTKRSLNLFSWVKLTISHFIPRKLTPSPVKVAPGSATFGACPRDLIGLPPFLGLYSLSGKTSYHKISWSLEAARFEFKLFQSLWNLAGTSAALLPRCLSNFRAIRLLQHPIPRLRDFTRFGGKASYRLVNRGPVCSRCQMSWGRVKSATGHYLHVLRTPG